MLSLSYCIRWRLSLQTDLSDLCYQASRYIVQSTPLACVDVHVHVDLDVDVHVDVDVDADADVDVHGHLKMKMKTWHIWTLQSVMCHNCMFTRTNSIAADYSTC